MAEIERDDLNHPYVGTEHFVLAYLKSNMIGNVSYNAFKNEIIKVIGKGTKKSIFNLYTPILRYVKNNFNDINLAINYILNNNNSIAYNIFKEIY